MSKNITVVEEDSVATDWIFEHPTLIDDEVSVYVTFTVAGKVHTVLAVGHLSEGLFNE